MKQPIFSKKIIILNKLIKSGYYIYFFIFKRCLINYLLYLIKKNID